MGLGKVLHLVECNHSHAFHSTANCVLADRKLMHNKKNQLPIQHIQDGGEAVQLTTQLTDLAVTEQKKPHTTSCELFQQACSTF